MLTCFDFLSLDCACTNLKLIDFPVQRPTYTPQISPTLCPIMTVATALPIHFHPCLTYRALTGADRICSLLGEETSL